MSNVIILCDKRTGSTFLQNALNSHPQIVAFDELFMKSTKANKRGGQVLYKYMQKTEKWSKEKYINWVFDQGQNVTFKLIYDQCDKWNLMPIIKKNKIPIIHLLRRNLLKKAVSRFSRGLLEPKKLDKKPEDYIKEIKKDKGKVDKFSKVLSKHSPVLTIYYEDIIGPSVGDKGQVNRLGAFNITSQRKTYVASPYDKQLCDFMGVYRERLYSNVSKKNSNNVWLYIKDEEEVKALLKKNRFGYMI